MNLPNQKQYQNSYSIYSQGVLDSDSVYIYIYI
jgi:hypothetical protein